MTELEMLRRALVALSEDDFDRVLGTALSAMVEVSGADRGFVVVPEGEGGAHMVLARAMVRPGSFPTDAPSRAIVARAVETRAAVRIENALEEAEFRGRPSVLAISVLSVLAVPIVSGDRALAVAYLDSVRLAGIFSAEAEAEAVRFAAAVAPGIRSAMELRSALAREQALRSRLAHGAGSEIIGRSPTFLAALDRALKAAPSDVPILIQGESGTGKELFARAIHDASRRARGPFVAINCGAIPEAILESELFGHVRGAFTGAISDRTGRIEAANGGTLFLDEVGDMPAALQVKLLRVLQSGEIQKVGESRDRNADVRVVAATHRDLRAAIRDGAFREDLFYRLRVVSVEIPPLRERGDDTVLLAETFVRRFAEAQRKDVAGLVPAAREALLRHAFPGNVRELENAIRHAVVFAEGRRVALSDLPVEIAGARREDDGRPEAGPVPRDLDELKVAKDAAVARVERAFIGTLLKRAGGNVARAARLARMNRSVLHELISRHGASAAAFRTT